MRLSTPGTDAFAGDRCAMPDVEARIPSEQILAHCVGCLEDVEWQPAT